MENFIPERSAKDSVPLLIQQNGLISSSHHLLEEKENQAAKEEALHHILQEVIAREPENVHALYELGLLRLRLRKGIEAIEALNIALEHIQPGATSLELRVRTAHIRALVLIAEESGDISQKEPADRIMKNWLELIRRDKTRAEVWNGQTLSFILSDYEDAAEVAKTSAEHMVQSFPSSIDGMNNLAVALLKCREFANAAKTLLDSSNMLGNPISLRHFHIWNNLAIAQVLFADGRLDDPEVYWKEAIDSGPHQAQVWSNIGVYHMFSGVAEAAITALRFASALSPEDMNIKANLAKVLVSVGRIDEASSVTDEIVVLAQQLHIKHSLSGENRPIALPALEDGKGGNDRSRSEIAEEAVRGLEGLILTSHVWEAIGSVAGMLKTHAGTMEEMKKFEERAIYALQRAGMGVFTYTEVGLLCMADGKYEAAQKWLKKAIAVTQQELEDIQVVDRDLQLDLLQSFLAVNYCNLAACLHVGGNLDEAREVYEELKMMGALEQPPTNSSPSSGSFGRAEIYLFGFYNNLGNLERQEGNLEAAAEHLMKCLDEHPTNPVFLNNLALVRLAQGDPSSAESLLGQALSVNPGLEYLKSNLLKTRYLLRDSHASKSSGGTVVKKE